MLDFQNGRVQDQLSSPQEREPSTMLEQEYRIHRKHQMGKGGRNGRCQLKANSFKIRFVDRLSFSFRSVRAQRFFRFQFRWILISNGRGGGRCVMKGVTSKQNVLKTDFTDRVSFSFCSEQAQRFFGFQFRWILAFTPAIRFYDPVDTGLLPRHAPEWEPLQPGYPWRFIWHVR